MKRIFGVLAAVALASIGTHTAMAGELLDSDRIITAMEDRWQGHAYRNTHTAESFVSALQDNHPGRYRNIHTAESFIAALGDGHEGYYRNTHTAESFVAALQDNHPGRYRNIHTAESFIASLGDGYIPGRYAEIMEPGRFAGLLAEKRAQEAETAAYAPGCGHRDIDYLATNVLLAKLSESCE